MRAGEAAVIAPERMKLETEVEFWVEFQCS